MNMVVGSQRRDAGSQYNNEDIGSQYSGSLDNIDGASTFVKLW